jgi:hypothetical protein
MPPDAAITEAWPVKSMITHPAPDQAFKAGHLIIVRGSAWAGDSDIAKVEVSFDEGVTWERARLHKKDDKYAWRRFSYEHVTQRPGYATVLARATDGEGRMQPIVPAWNPLGYFWNGIHRVGFMIEKA